MVDSNDDSNKKSGLTPLQGTFFLLGVTGTAALGGFAMMLAKSKKSHPDDFYKSAISNDNGTKLALRALGRATVYSVGGFSILCMIVWKSMGVHNLKEFTSKMQSLMPRLSPENPKKEEVDWNEIFKGGKQSKNTKDQNESDRS